MTFLTQYCWARGKRFLKKKNVHLAQIFLVPSTVSRIWDVPAIGFEMIKSTFYKTLIFVKMKGV